MVFLIAIATILGGILLLILALLALFLFVPFRFDIFVSNSSKLTLKVKASWLFKLIGVYYEQKGDKSKWRVSILFVQLGRKKKKAIKPTPSKGLEPKPTPKSEPKPEPKPKPEERISLEDIDTDGGRNDTSEDIMEKLRDAKDKFDYVYNHPDKDILIRLTIKLCVELLRALKPKRFHVNGVIGTGDPSLTGQLIGAIYVMGSFTGLDFNIKGDFENAFLNGELKVESNIYIYKFVVPLVKYALSKPVWRLIKKFIFRKDAE